MQHPEMFTYAATAHNHHVDKERVQLMHDISREG
jgi:hypothetical protein